MLTSASCKSEADRIADFNNTNKNSMFVAVEAGPYWLIVYDKHTKVMYTVSDSYENKGSGVFTVLVNADGSPILYNEK